MAVAFKCSSNLAWYEPRHEKTNKMSVRPAKTQISLAIRPVWSESSLCAQWVAKDPRFLHADSEDSDQTGQMPRLIWVFAGCTLTLLVLSCHGSYDFFASFNHNFCRSLNQLRWPKWKQWRLRSTCTYAVSPKPLLCTVNKPPKRHLQSYHSLAALCAYAHSLLPKITCKKNIMVKIVKKWTPQKNCCNHTNIWTRWPYHKKNGSKRCRQNGKQCRPWSDYSSRVCSDTLEH